MTLTNRPAGTLKTGDRVVCNGFGIQAVETVTELPAGTVRVDLTAAVVLFADPTYTLTVLEDVAA